jgi:cobalt-zinc-cadmium efflux system membrane fusion protein
MKNLLLCGLIVASLLIGCGKKEEAGKPKELTAPVTSEGGNKIVFPDEQTSAFFNTETAVSSLMAARFSAPAKVAATVAKSGEGAQQNIILFEDPSLASNYTELLTHQQKIRQLQGIIDQKEAVIARKKIEVARFEDLFKNGAGTGKDLADAQVDLLSARTESSMTSNDLAAERTAIIEHETRLKIAGFNPASLRQAGHGKAFVICEVPESQIENIREGGHCTLRLNAFPNQTYQGKIDDVADLMDQASQMVKVRITVDNSGGRFKAGMFATVAMGISQGNNISIDKNALVTVQGKSYVFVKNGEKTFIRKPVSLGSLIEERFIVYDGLKVGDSVAVKGVMQLKGLSFGY